MTLTKVEIRFLVHCSISILTVSIKRNLMEINMFHLFSDTQNRYKKFGTIIKILSQREPVMRPNALLRQRHLIV